MKRLALIAVPVLLCLLAMAMRPAEGQDNLQVRVSALETKVADLEAQVEISAADATPRATHTITGQLTLYGSRHLDDGVIHVEGTQCVGAGSYDDIQVGAAITIRDGNDSTIAVGRLPGGQWEPISGANGMCVFEFSVEDVPDTAFYSVEIGQREEVAASREEFEENNWEIILTLGSS